MQRIPIGLAIVEAMLPLAAVTPFAQADSATQEASPLFGVTISEGD
jgi:hypothetical protein